MRRTTTEIEDFKKYLKIISQLKLQVYIKGYELRISKKGMYLLQDDRGKTIKIFEKTSNLKKYLEIND